jgi:hypothetical protein
MKVKELIEKLQQLDPDLEVVTKGYEGGYQYADGSFDPFDLALNVHTAWYYGPHEDAEDTYNVPDKSKVEIVKAICI